LRVEGSTHCADDVYRVSVPVYVILGHQDEHLGLMIAMEEMKLFDKGDVTNLVTLPFTQN
jgi:hypothetical protein